MLLSVVTLEALKDNTLFETGTGTVSNGAGEYFFVGRIDETSGAIRRGLIAFDVAGNIPSGATINSVTLRLNMWRTGSGNQTVELRRVLSDWGEGTSKDSGQLGTGTLATPNDATWLHTFYDTDFWVTAGGDFSATASASTTVGGVGLYTWGSAGMVADVQRWLITPATNFGWLLRGNEGAAAPSPRANGCWACKRFDSRENSIPANRPKLIVDYTPAPNAPPDAMNDAYTGNEDALLAIAAPGVLGNDTDINGDALSAHVLVLPANGSLTLSPNGSFTYTPAVNFNGSDAFTYEACDPFGACDSATVTITVRAVNDPPVANDDSAATDEDTPATIDVRANDTDVDGNLDPASVRIVSGPAHGTARSNGDGTVTYTPQPNFNGTDRLDYQICDTGSPALCDTATLTIVVRAVPDQLAVTSITPTRSGFEVQFNRLIDASVLNLYDTETGGLGPADAVLQGAVGGLIRGSLIVDPGLRKVTFVATGGLLTSLAGDGVLPPDTYTVKLRSAADGFRDTSGKLLDGNGDDLAGDDYVNNFTVTSTSAVLVGVPDFARGPGQPVNVPAGAVPAAGLPIRLSDGSGVDSVELTLAFDPASLNVSNVALGVSVPAGSTLTFDLTVPGQVRISLVVDPMAPLASGPIDILSLTASVPCAAAYLSAHVVDIAQVSINDGALAAEDDDGVHAVAYLGDATGNGGYSSLDAQRLHRVVVRLDSGFLPYPRLDPVVIADITGNGALSGLDETRLQQEVVGLDPPEIPPIPVCTSATPSAALPGNGTPLSQQPASATVNTPTDPRSHPGQTLLTPVNVDETNLDGLITLLASDEAGGRNSHSAEDAGSAADRAGDPEFQTTAALGSLGSLARAGARGGDAPAAAHVAVVPGSTGLFKEELEDLIALLVGDQAVSHCHISR